MVCFVPFNGQKWMGLAMGKFTCQLLLPTGFAIVEVQLDLMLNRSGNEVRCLDLYRSPYHCNIMMATWLSMCRWWLTALYNKSLWTCQSSSKQIWSHLLITGDLMEILSRDQGDWWMARHINPKPGRREGYIPSNYVARHLSLNAEV